MSKLGNKQIFANNLQYYMNLNRRDRSEICKDLDISYSTFSEWITAKKYPRIDKIEMLADYFNIQKSDLIEERGASDEMDEIIQQIKDRPEMRALFSKTAKASKEDVLKTIKMIDVFREENHDL